MCIIDIYIYTTSLSRQSRLRKLATRIYGQWCGQPEGALSARADGSVDLLLSEDSCFSMWTGRIFGKWTFLCVYIYMYIISKIIKVYILKYYTIQLFGLYILYIFIHRHLYIRWFFFWKVPFMYSFSIRQFIWEYIGDFFFWKVPFMYSFSIRQFIWEYVGDFSFFGKFPLCIRFQLGNSFGNT